MRNVALKKISLALLVCSYLLPQNLDGQSLLDSNATSWMNLVINEFLASNQDNNYDEYEDDDDWVEIWNMSEEIININGIYISDDFSEPHKYQVFSTDSSLINIYPDSFLVLWADDKYDNNVDQGALHLPFKLSASGEEIGIYTPDSTVIIDTVSFGEQTTNISMGRQPGGGGLWNYFEVPTPGSANTTPGMIGLSPTPTITTPGGFYTNAIEIQIVTDSSDAEIFYTLDGSEPDTTSTHYQTAFYIDQNRVVRARCFQTGFLPGKIATATYLFNEDTEIDVISLVTDPGNLWGESGIYTHPRQGWEKPIHVEYYETEGELGFAIDGGVKIHGPSGGDQKSFRLYARSRYGDEAIQYQIFEDKDVDSFKRLVLRNGGNDGLQLGSVRTHFRDAAAQAIYKELSPNRGVSAYKPVHVYLNGSYWGIYNLRERIDEYFIASNYGYEDEIDLLERAFEDNASYLIIEGDWVHFNSMVNFADSEDLSLPENYEYMKTQMSIQDFCDYWIFEIFAGNFDWLSNNIKLWRPRTSSGKWKWILWDVDHGLGLPLANYGLPEWNTLDWATSTYTGRPWEGQNTRLIRNLLENEEFNIYFINRFADLLNSYLHPSTTIPIIDSLQENLAFDVPRQIDKWGGSMTNWDLSVDGVREYLTVRPGFVNDHILDKFSLDSVVTVIINVEPQAAGKILINTIKPDEYPWEGDYFSNIPITLLAEPALGFRVAGWSNTLSDSAITEIYLTGDTVVTVHFEVAEPSLPIVMNEINYNSADYYNPGDWVELYNHNETSVDLSYSQFADETHTFIFPENTIIPAEQFLTLSSDFDAFNDIFPELESQIMALEFGLSNNGEILQLFNAQDSLIDYVEYDEVTPWPAVCNGGGYTLELIAPELDNGLSQNWIASTAIGGTPGNHPAPVSIAGEENPIVAEFALLHNYPNPFNPSTTIRYGLPKDTNVSLVIYDLRGSVMQTLESEQQPAGWHDVVWNGQTANGNTVSTGIYFARLVAGEYSQTIKMLYLK